MSIKLTWATPMYVGTFLSEGPTRTVLNILEVSNSYANSESYNGPSEPMPDHSRSRPSGEKRDESWLFFSGTHNLGRYDCFSPKSNTKHTKNMTGCTVFERILHCFLALQWSDVECAFSKRYCIYYRWIPMDIWDAV